MSAAGTSDLRVAEEAAVTAEAFGCEVRRYYDVGVAGIHRLFDNIEEIQQATVSIVVAGMDGALPSVVGGLVSHPVIAVPTSVGYGASFNGLAALLTMLNSCASGISVVNIDNGFGGAFNAALIHRLAQSKRGGVLSMAANHPPNHEHIDHEMLKMEVNLDDISGELLGYLMDLLIESGANDVYYTSIYMKKNRPGILLQLLMFSGKSLIK